MKRKLVLLCTFCVFSYFFACASDVNPAETEQGYKKNAIAGSVSNGDTKRPIKDVNITAYFTSRKEKVVLTDANGHYAFEDLRPGVYKFVFEKDGYKKVVKDKVVIKANEGFDLDVEMLLAEDFNFLPNTFNFSGFEK